MDTDAKHDSEKYQTDSGMWRLFVYARLKRPGMEDNASIEGDLRRLGNGDLAARFGAQTTAGFAKPHVVRIWGQVIHVDDKALKNLDRLEGSGKFRYERVPIKTAGGVHAYAFQYVGDDFSKLPKVTSTWDPSR